MKALQRSIGIGVVSTHKVSGNLKKSSCLVLLKILIFVQADSLLLEGHIKALQGSMGEMTEHPSNKSRMYVTNDDIIKLSSIGEDVVFAVTAPYGTTLVVPDPDEGVEQGGERRYRCLNHVLSFML